MILEVLTWVHLLVGLWVSLWLSQVLEMFFNKAGRRFTATDGSTGSVPDRRNLNFTELAQGLQLI